MSTVETYDVENLRQLNRREIQHLAKTNGVKANGKTEVLILQLIEKFPDGVARETATNETPATRKRTITKIKAEETEPQKRTSKRRKMGNAPTEAETQPSAIEQPPGVLPEAVEPLTSAVEQLPAAENLSPTVEQRQGVVEQVPHAAERLPSPAEQQAPSGTPAATQIEIVHREQDAPQRQRGTGVGPKDVRRVKRELTKLVNGAAEIRVELAETRMLIEHMKTEVMQRTADQLALVGWNNFATEGRVLRQFKRNRKLWDGTPFMQPGPKQAWKGFLNELEEEKMVESLNSAAQYEAKRRRRRSRERKEGVNV